MTFYCIEIKFSASLIMHVFCVFRIYKDFRRFLVPWTSLSILPFSFWSAASSVFSCPSRASFRVPGRRRFRSVRNRWVCGNPSGRFVWKLRVWVSPGLSPSFWPPPGYEGSLSRPCLFSFSFSWSPLLKFRQFAVGFVLRIIDFSGDVRDSDFGHFEL